MTKQAELVLDPRNVTLEGVAAITKQHAANLAADAPADRSYDMIMRAVQDPACDPGKLRELLAVRREWKADEAKAAFNRAVVQFQQQCAIIPKLDKAYDKQYARMDRIWRTSRPLLQECGLAVTWESVVIQGKDCTLEGHLRHAEGHAQPLHHVIPLPDAIKGQNSAQQAASGETYAKRYATCAALGVQTGDDDDGDAGRKGSAEAITADQVTTLRSLLKAKNRTDENVLRWASAQAERMIEKLEDMPQDLFAQAVAALGGKQA